MNETASEDSADVPAELTIIAGRGAYPIELAQSARKQGVQKVFAMAFRGETDRKLAEHVDDMRWARVGELATFLATMDSFGAHHAVMAGQIRPTNLFRTRFDKPMRQLIGSLPRKNADTIFAAVGEKLRERDIELGHAGRFMESRMPAAGVLTARAPGEQELADIQQGVELAKLVAHYDVGQSVCIK